MASFEFLNLTHDIRQLMLSEIESDAENKKLYLSERLNTAGLARYQALLVDAVTNGDEESFQNALQSGNYFNSTELRQGKSAKVPSNAAQVLAQSEFNRFYIRAVCLQAIKQGKSTVEIYRARESSWARPESEMKIGKAVNAEELLTDMRDSIGKAPHILPEINSGLSVKI